MEDKITYLYSNGNVIQEEELNRFNSTELTLLNRLGETKDEYISRLKRHIIDCECSLRGYQTVQYKIDLFDELVKELSHATDWVETLGGSDKGGLLKRKKELIKKCIK